MNKIIFFMSEDKLKGFEMKGHADFYNDRGIDLACAGLSVLSQNLVFSILKLTEFNEEDIKLVMNKEKALLSMILPNTYNEKANLLMDSFKLGIEVLKKTYPRNITLKVREVK